MAVKYGPLVRNSEQKVENDRKPNHGEKVTAIARQLEQLEARFVEIDPRQ
jgi:hypothetical protein